MKWFRIVCGVLILIGAVAIYYGLTFPMLQPETQKVWLPDNYEIYKSSAVESSTFKIHRSLGDFQKLSNEKRVLVVYREGFIESVSPQNSFPYIEYWSQRGDGTFDYFKQIILPSMTQPYSRLFWVTWQTKFGGDSFTLNPSNNFSLVFVGGIFIFLIVLVWWNIEVYKNNNQKTIN